MPPQTPPGGPGNPGGPPNNPMDLGPVTTALQEQTALLAKMADLQKKTSDNADDYVQTIVKGKNELKHMVALAEDMDSALKAMVAGSKKLQQAALKSKTYEDQKKMYVQMAKAFKAMEKRAKGNAQMEAAAKRGYEESTRALRDMWSEHGKMGNKLIENHKHVLDLISDFERLQKVAKGIQVSHIGRQVRGISQALGASGLTKGGVAARMEKHAELAVKMREMRKERLRGNRETFMARRADVLADVNKQYGTDPRSEARAQALAAAMGVPRRKRAAFVQAEKAGGRAENFGALAEHGTGAGGLMSRVASGVEGGIGGLAAMLANPAAAILAELGTLALSAFDKAVEQNKAMETGLGKGGLFSAAPGSAGFMQARTALTPGGVGFTQMGMSFERNLKIAQAVVEGGYNIAELVTGERGKGPAGAGYMPGAMGQFQQIAMGAGRVAGFTDVEGVQQTMKLLGQYRATLKTSNEFFVAVARDSKAAGLSTGKYVQILDDMNAHFDRMNKSLGTSIGVLATLGRTGSVSADAMKGLLDFFTQGAKTTFEGVAQKTFSRQQMGLMPGMTKALDDRELRQINQSLDAASGAMHEVGLGKLPGAEQLVGMGGAGLNRFVQERLFDIRRSSADEKLKQQAEDSLTLASKQATALIMERGGDLAYGTSQYFNQGDLVHTMAENISDVVTAGRLSGVGLKGIMAPGDLTPEQRMAMGGALEKVLGKDYAKGVASFQQAQSLAAGTRLTQAMDNEDQAKELVTQLVTRLPGFREEYKSKKFTNLAELNGKESVEYLKEMGGKLTAAVGYLDETAVFQMGQDKDNKTVTPADEKQALAMGRAIGMQTQTSADVIANAFSTWFNDIIGLLGKLAVHFLGISPEDQKTTKAMFESAQYQKDYATALEGVEEKLAAAAAAQVGFAKEDKLDEAEAERKKWEGLKAERDKIMAYSDAASQSSLTPAEAQARLDYMAKAAGRQTAEEQKQNLSDLIAKSGGTPESETTGEGISYAPANPRMRMSNADFDRLSKIPQVSAALGAGALVAGHDAGGVTLTITTNNNFNQNLGAPTPGQLPAGAPGTSGSIADFAGMMTKQH